MPETRTLQRFRSRTEYLEQHLQLVDISLTKLIQIAKPHRHTQKSIVQSLDIRGDRHSRLHHPVDHLHRLCNFSRSRNIELAIQSLYRSFAEYMHGILGEMYSHNPKMIVGKAPGTLGFHELVDLKSYDKIIERMIDDVFRKLEGERSTIKLLEKVLAHTNIQLSAEQKSQALSYLEMRHLIVHNNSCADAKFVENYGGIIPVTVGQKLPMQFPTAAAAITAVSELVLQIDCQLIQLGLAADRE